MLYPRRSRQSERSSMDRSMQRSQKGSLSAERDRRKDDEGRKRKRRRNRTESPEQKRRKRQYGNEEKSADATRGIMATKAKAPPPPKRREPLNIAAIVEQFRPQLRQPLLMRPPPLRPPLLMRPPPMLTEKKEWEDWAEWQRQGMGYAWWTGW